MPFVVIEAMPNAAGYHTVEAWSWPPEFQRPTRISVDVDAKGVKFGDTFFFESNDAIWWRPAGKNITIRARTLGNPYVLAHLPEDETSDEADDEDQGGANDAQ